MKILYPTLVLLGDQDQSIPFNEAFLRARFQSEVDTCWSVNPDAVVSSYNFDEPALFHTANSFVGDPVLDLTNVARVQSLAREVMGIPSMIVEGPGPLLFPFIGLDDATVQQLNEGFFFAFDEIKDGVDQYGFDVYPVPNFSLTEPGNFVLEGRRLAPATDPLIVLQAFAPQRFTGGASPGRGPTEEETRFTVFDSVAMGANSVLWFGASSLDLLNAEDAAIWDGITAVTRELQQIIPWVEGEPLKVTLQEGVGLRVFRAQGELLFIISNRTASEQTITTDTPINTPGAITTIAGVAPSAAPNTLTVTIPAFGVSVARIAELP